MHGVGQGIAFTASGIILGQPTRQDSKILTHGQPLTDSIDVDRVTGFHFQELLSAFMRPNRCQEILFGCSGCPGLKGG